MYLPNLLDCYRLPRTRDTEVHIAKTNYAPRCGHLYLLQLVVETPVVLQREQLLRDNVQRQRLRARLRPDVVAVADVDGARVELILTNDYRENVQYGPAAYTRDSTHRG